MNIFVKIVVVVVVLLGLVLGIKTFFFKEKPRVAPKNVDVIQKLKEAGEKKGIEFAQVEITGDFDLVATYHSIKIIFSTDGDFDKKIISLQKVLKSTKMEGSVKEIDFRFNKIVLRY